MNRSRRPLNEKQRLPTRRVRRTFTLRTPEPLSATATRMSRGENFAKRETWARRGRGRGARGAVRSTATPATAWPAAPGAAAAWPGAAMVSGTATEREEPLVARTLTVPGVARVSVARPSAPVVALAPPAVTVTPAAGPGVEVPGVPLVLNCVTATTKGVPAVADAGTLLSTSGKTVGLKL